jgi:subtilase family serine protease
LTALLLTSTHGQPDYITFNGQDLGTLATPEAEYLPGARDIGNERSSDANGGSGIDTRYADLEVFDVTSLLKDSNKVVFERGRDLDGDGVVVTASALSEGEDYIHPVLAMLVVKKGGDSLPPDLSVDPISIQGAYQGESATITAIIRNTGLVSTAPVDVVFSVDGVPVASKQIIIGYQGIQGVEGSWQATPGDHTITVTVNGDSDTSNNAASRSITVGSLPDLAVSLGNPGSPVAGGTSSNNVPFPLAGAIAGGMVLTWWMARKRPSPVTLPALFLAIGIFALALVPSVAGAGGGVTEYPIPVTVTNTGGSNAPAFVLSLYLDGEKVAEQTVTEGVPAGKAITVTIPLFTTAGRHTLRAVADELGTIPEKDRANNSAERVYEFP